MSGFGDSVRSNSTGRMELRRSVDWTPHFSNALRNSLFALPDEFMTGITQHLQRLSGEFFWDEYIIGVVSRDGEDGDAVVR